MSLDAPLQAGLVDVVFPLVGRSVPQNYAQALRDALLKALPWLAEQPQAGIHQVKLAHGSGSQSLLSGRSRLILRLPREDLEKARALAGQTLSLQEQPVQLGQPYERELLPHATLYAHAVVANQPDESEFVQQVIAGLAALDLRAPWICGRQGSVLLDGQPLTTFSLMVHNLSVADSLRLQVEGLGAHRLLGCGIFIPHKNTAAVGE